MYKFFRTRGVFFVNTGSKSPFGLGLHWLDDEEDFDFGDDGAAAEAITTMQPNQHFEDESSGDGDLLPITNSDLETHNLVWSCATDARARANNTRRMPLPVCSNGHTHILFNLISAGESHKNTHVGKSVVNWNGIYTLAHLPKESLRETCAILLLVWWNYMKIVCWSNGKVQLYCYKLLIRCVPVIAEYCFADWIKQ